MFARLMPSKTRFFDLLNRHAAELVLAARALKVLMDSGDDYQRRAYEIESIEKRGDKITQAVLELLHHTLITPLDRDDIHQLISRMDDVLDLIEDTSESVYIFDVGSITPEARHLADICVACVEKLHTAVAMLPAIDDAKAIFSICQEIDRLESEADHVMRDAMARLFRGEADVKRIMTMRSIYELLESVTDRCEDVANIIQAIVLENS